MYNVPSLQAQFMVSVLASDSTSPSRVQFPPFEQAQKCRLGENVAEALCGSVAMSVSVSLETTAGR